MLLAQEVRIANYVTPGNIVAYEDVPVVVIVLRDIMHQIMALYLVELAQQGSKQMHPQAQLGV